MASAWLIILRGTKGAVSWWKTIKMRMEGIPVLGYLLFVRCRSGNSYITRSREHSPTSLQAGIIGDPILDEIMFSIKYQIGPGSRPNSVTSHSTGLGCSIPTVSYPNAHLPVSPFICLAYIYWSFFHLGSLSPRCCLPPCTSPIISSPPL